MVTKEIIDKRKNTTSGRIRRKNESLIIRAAVEEFVTHGFKGASMKRISERANMSRTNIHYYFKYKLDLYGAILSDILELWNVSFDRISDDDTPRGTLEAYIRAKVMYSKTNPSESRLFASEIIHGAPYLSNYLSCTFREWINQKSSVIQSWIDKGKMDPIDPYHLLFFIWGATQHYADFGVQVLAAMDKDKFTDYDFEIIADNLTHIILKGSGIKE